MTRSAINALIVDIIAGEPPDRVSPTAWMDRYLSGGRARHARGRGPMRALQSGEPSTMRARATRSDTWSFAEGALLLAGGVALAAASAGLVERLLGTLPKTLRETANGFALKPALSLRPIIGAARRVQYALEDGALENARMLLSRDLVARNTSTLTEEEVAGAVIESLAEKLSSGVVAPLLAYRLGGLPAAYAYRIINSADAMLGSHTPELEWFGKAAARADHAVNFLPARITAALICAAALSARGSAESALRIARRDARKTASPNAGWPTAAMAGALDVRLARVDQFALNAGGYSPIPRDIARACRIALTVSAAAAGAVDLL